MAIERHTDMGNGTAGNYWALSAVSKVAPKGNEVEVEVEFSLWVDKAAHAAGVHPLRRLRRLRAVVAGSDPKLSEIGAAVEAGLLRPAVAMRAATAADPAVAAVAGGQLEGGTHR